MLKYALILALSVGTASASYIPNPVTSGAKNYLVQSAVISSGSTVSSQSGSWISFSTSPGTGDYTFTMSGFSATPSCVCTRIRNDESTDRDYNCNVHTISSSSIRLNIRDRVTTTTSMVAGNYNIICMGLR